jgi:hypothetical protein
VLEFKRGRRCVDYHDTRDVVGIASLDARSRRWISDQRVCGRGGPGGNHYYGRESGLGPFGLGGVSTSPVEVNEGTLAAIGQHPWFGIGLGTFKGMFAQ